MYPISLNENQERLQGLRPVYRNGSLTSSSSQAEIAHVDIHLDPAGKEIVLWADILVAFKDPVNVRLKTRILPFLKDAQFNVLEPLRIAAMPNTVLDVYVEDQLVQTNTAASLVSSPISPPSQAEAQLISLSESQAGTQSATQTQAPPQSKRNTAYDPMDMANTLLKGPQATSDNTIWGYTLHNHSIITQSSVNPNNKDGADDGTTITKDMMDTTFKAKQGDIRAQVKLATAYKHCSNGLSQSYESAMDWFLQAADRVNPLAQLQVGLLHQNGHGVPQDYVKTMKWYPKAANQGDAKAQFNAKVFHRIIPRQRNGISSPPTKDIIAQHNIASLYELGLGVAKDYSMAKEWYLKAADQGCVSSLIHLGDIFFYGRGDLDRFGRDVPRNFSEALEFYRKAGELGDATVQFQVGLLYNTGQGVKLDTIKAIEWYRKAAEQGHAMAKNRLEFLKTRGYRVK
ncbi:hypothetical protein BGX29_004256 [Mortierella sp. GBA35]|nr:hypothetical protein BGX29_004256 [Mortierella sp. GBA35]